MGLDTDLLICPTRQIQSACSRQTDLIRVVVITGATSDAVNSAACDDARRLSRGTIELRHFGPARDKRTPSDHPGMSEKCPKPEVRPHH